MSKISDFKIVEEKLDEKRQDYMGSKYSQHLGGSISEEEMERQKKENDAFAEKQFWREIDNEDYTKKQTFCNFNFFILNMINMIKLISRKEKNVTARKNSFFGPDFGRFKT